MKAILKISITTGKKITNIDKRKNVFFSSCAYDSFKYNFFFIKTKKLKKGHFILRLFMYEISANGNLYTL